MSAEGELRGSQARSLSIRSCLHRLSMDVENLPFLGLLFSVSKKWEAVQGHYSRGTPSSLLLQIRLK